MYDFVGWSERLGCGKEPLEGPLYIHTAWAGSIDNTLHNKSSVRGDFEALLDSFLMTQDTRTAKFIFWWMTPQVGPPDPLQIKYAAHSSIEFRQADIKGMSVGTPLEGHDEILEMGDHLEQSSKSKRPRQLANMFRTLALHKMGGIWVDTDTLILRDMRPLLEYAGEFGTQLSISIYYNNNFMGLRAGSELGWFLLDIIVKTGLPPVSPPSPPGVASARNWPQKYCKYVTRSGGDCYEIWYWNHGSIQLALFEERGIVVIPTGFSDPGYQSCYAPYLMGWHGGLTMRGLTIQEELELIRGSFIIHTRAYNAAKPLGERSNFYRLYELFREGREANIPDPVPAMPLGQRSAAEEAEFDRIWTARLALTPRVNQRNVVEPPWYPKPYPTSPRSRVRIQLKDIPDAGLGMHNQVERNLGGNGPVGYIKGSQLQTWAWNPGPPGQGGHFRPWIARPPKVLCLDGDAQEAYGSRAPPGVVVAAVVCNPTRRSQKWLFAVDRIVNVDSKLCLEAPPSLAEGGENDKATMLLLPCSDSDRQLWSLVGVAEPQPPPRFGRLPAEA
jgi:hypothetical protein